MEKINIKKKVYQIKNNLKKYLVDYFVISFPKCGRTWVRFFLGKYDSLYYGRPQKFKIKNLLFTHCLANISPDILNVKKEILKLKSKKVIFITRDPRDVLISYYFQYTKRENHPEINLSNFIRNDKLGIKRILEFNSLVYENRRIFKEFIIINYEDLKKNPIYNFKKILKFLNKNIDYKILEEAVRESSFHKMRKIEENKIFNEYALCPGKKDDPDSYKVRRGKVGGYKEYLNENDLSYINKIITDYKIYNKK